MICVQLWYCCYYNSWFLQYQSFASTSLLNSLSKSFYEGTCLQTSKQTNKQNQISHPPKQPISETWCCNICSLWSHNYLWKKDSHHNMNTTYCSFLYEITQHYFCTIKMWRNNYVRAVGFFFSLSYPEQVWSTSPATYPTGTENYS